MQSAGHAIQFDKAGGQTGHRTAIFIQFFDLFDRRHDQFFGRNEIGFDMFSGNGKNLFLGFIQ